MAGFRLFAVAVALLATVAEANVATRLAAPTARVARNFVSPFARKFLPDIPRRQPPQTTPFYFTAVAVSQPFTPLSSHTAPRPTHSTNLAPPSTVLRMRRRCGVVLAP